MNLKSLIPNVKEEATSNRWKNEKGAEFQYNETEIWYQIIELTPDLCTYIINPCERNKENCPVIALGFVAYLIHNWGKPETGMYTGFYERCLSDFINKEEKLPGAFMRNLRNEYYKNHIEEENARVSYSQKIYPYLTDNDSKLISQYLESYFDFIKIKYGYQTPESSKHPEQHSILEIDRDLNIKIKQNPIFKPETIEPIINLLKSFFHPERHNELNALLETGNDVLEPLIFLDNGNRLADAFKQLIKADIITGCDQIQLENWIFKNFKYIHRGQKRDYTQKYLNDIISTNKDKCQKPILNIMLDKSTGKIIISKT